MASDAEAMPRPRRSALYMPGANERALEKGKSLSADVLIMDLEDGVAPDTKAEARARIGAAGRQRVLDRWTWRLCAVQTVEQYREVLAMPDNIAKLKRNGRIK